MFEGGFEENEAQALVDAMTEASTEHFATKTDISDLRGELKTDIADLRGQTMNIKWMVTTLLIVISASSASFSLPRPSRREPHQITHLPT